MPYLEITEVVLIHCNVANNSYQQISRVLYTFVPNKSSVQTEDQIFVEGYRFLSVARNMGKNTSKSLGAKYRQRLLDHAKKSTTDSIKTASKETEEATGDLIRNKIADKNTRTSQESQKPHHSVMQKQRKKIYEE